MHSLKLMKDYTYHTGLLLRIYPSDKQKKMIRSNAGSYRFVYNRLVAIDNERYTLRKTAHLCPSDNARLGYLDVLRSSVSAFCVGIPFLAEKEMDSDMIQQAFANYARAWKNCKEEHRGKPTFHKKTNEYAYRTSNHYSSKKEVAGLAGLYAGSIRFDGKSHIILPKLGRIRFTGSKNILKHLFARTVETRIGSTKIWIDETGACYVSLALASDYPFHTYYPQTKKAVGMDLNLTNFLFDSDGTEVETPKYLRKAEAKLKKAQRKLSGKLESAKKDKRDYWKCKNYEEQRIKLARLHKHVANQRLNFIRNVANEEVKNYDYLFAEDLKVRNLIKNHKHAKAISDSGWRIFLTELQNTASKRGKTCLLVNPKNTTQTCSNCGYVCHGDTRVTLGTEEWICPQCGTFHVRDHNAGKNILATGLALLRESGVAISIA